MSKWLNSFMLIGAITCLAAVLTGVMYHFEYITLSEGEKKSLFAIYCIGSAAVMLPAFYIIFLRTSNVKN